MRKLIGKLVDISIVLFISVHSIILVHKSCYEYLMGQMNFNMDRELITKKLLPYIGEQKLDKGDIQSTISRNLNTLDKSFSKEISKILYSSPRIKKVIKISKKLPDEIEVRFLLRKPFVILASNNGLEAKTKYYLLDYELMVISDDIEEFKNEFAKIPIIYAKSFNERIVVGKICNNPEVLAGADVIHTLSRKFREGLNEISVVSVDLKNQHYEYNSAIILWLKNGIPVEWGESSKYGNFLETPEHKKIENFKQVFEVLLNSDAKHIKSARIQFDQPYLRINAPYIVNSTY